MSSRSDAAQDTTTQKLMTQLKDLMSEADEILKTHNGSEGFDAGALLHSAIDNAKSTYVRLEDKALDSAKRTDSAIRENPYPALGIAVGVGLVVGFFLGRK